MFIDLNLKVFFQLREDEMTFILQWNRCEPTDHADPTPVVFAVLNK